MRCFANTSPNTSPNTSLKLALKDLAEIVPRHP